MTVENNKGRLRKKILNPVVCSIGAAVGIFGGVSALITGLFCVLVHAALAADSAFGIVGTVLFIVAIPMLLMGSALMDEIDRR
ncbi:MAG: hypothetical protein ACKVQW_03270 [Pyrinomonadaceae bacterium]